MNKRRCTQCKKFFDPPEEDMGVMTFCSTTCHFEYAATPKFAVHRQPLTAARREEVVWGDERRCRFCGTPFDLRVHHIKYRSEQGSDDKENLVTLCEGCHGVVHSNKSYYQPLLLELAKLREAGDRTTMVTDLMGDEECS